jgi:hypothetical protein
MTDIQTIVAEIQKLDKIVPSELAPDDQWRRNIEYVRLQDVLDVAADFDRLASHRPLAGGEAEPVAWRSRNVMGPEDYWTYSSSKSAAHIQYQEQPLYAAPPIGPAVSPEDKFEHFVAAAIAKSPAPLQELGEYLTRVLDEDEWPTAEAFLLQLATTSFAVSASKIPGAGLAVTVMATQLAQAVAFDETEEGGGCDIGAGMFGLKTSELLRTWARDFMAIATTQPIVAVTELPEIERDGKREYIPFGAGWEIQTKGGGSTFRLSWCDPTNKENYERWAVLDDHLHEPLIRMANEVRAYAQAARLQGVTEKYNELILSVEKAFPDESRHETALRYIREREASGSEGGCKDALLTGKRGE